MRCTYFFTFVDGNVAIGSSATRALKSMVQVMRLNRCNWARGDHALQTRVAALSSSISDKSTARQSMISSVNSTGRRGEC